MGFMDRFMSRGNDYEEEYEDEWEKEPPAKGREFERREMEENRTYGQNVIDFQNAASARDSVVAAYHMKVMVIEPKSFDDSQEVANCLREKRPVVINLEHTDPETAKRIIDFASGTTYALNGDIKKVGKNVFLCAPNNVNVSYTDENEKKGFGDMPWLRK